LDCRKDLLHERPLDSSSTRPSIGPTILPCPTRGTKKDKARLWRAVKRISSEAWVKPPKKILVYDAAKVPNGSQSGLELQRNAFINPDPKAVKKKLLYLKTFEAFYLL
jgi:hypothetical protein